MTRPDEVVYQIDMSKSDKEIQAQFDRNTEAKLRHAARREQERFDAPSPIIDAFVTICMKIENMFQKKKTK